jgi:hypothetical protein
MNTPKPHRILIHPRFFFFFFFLLWVSAVACDVRLDEVRRREEESW